MLFRTMALGGRRDGDRLCGIWGKSLTVRWGVIYREGGRTGVDREKLGLRVRVSHCEIGYCLLRERKDGGRS